MAYSASKHHIGLNSEGYTISIRNGKRYYQKKRAPSFVNKYGGGDVAYRDATFWQYFVQTNWRNGAKQQKFDDPGKFWKSYNVDTSELEELTLSKELTSVGQVASGVKVNAIEGWRSAQNWWDANYGYRQQLTITAPSTQQVPAGYPIKIAIDTAALQTASKVRSDRKDWRVVYWNGTGWEDLVRDYATTTATFFGSKAAISAGASDTNYYVYYGYSSESTDKQPTTEADWNSVYGFFGTTPDANSLTIYHTREGSGATLNDDSSSSINATLVNSPSWGTDGKFGRYITFNGSNQYATFADLDLISFTAEAWIYPASTGTSTFMCQAQDTLGSSWGFSFTSGKFVFSSSKVAGGSWSLTSTTTPSINTWYHVAVASDGTNAKLYVNGSLEATTASESLIASSQTIVLGARKEGSYFDYYSGRMQHIRFSNVARTSFPYILSSEPTVTAGSETTTQPPASTYDTYIGCDDGKVYKYDGVSTFTEVFDCKRLTWFEPTVNDSAIIGDDGGTEKAAAQSFQLAATTTVSGASFWLKKNAGTPGDINIRVETDSSSAPSGTLANASATATITAFTTTDYAWVTVTFAGTFSLSATTTYWLVAEMAAGSNDNNYVWGSLTAGGYSGGNNATSTNGGSTWSAGTKDHKFRLLGNDTSVNCMLVTSVGGTQKLYIGTGEPTGETNGDARLYSYDGSNFALTYTFATATESAILSMAEYTANSSVYLGISPQAKIYSTANFSAFTLSKNINSPYNPGYPYALKEYNGVMHAGGGSPEYLPSGKYNGFFFTYDTATWTNKYPFDFTVLTSMEFYDAYLFLGTYRGDTFVYDTSTLTPLFNFKEAYKYNVEIKAMKYYDDKLYMALYPQENSNETNVGIWKFDRRGMSLAHVVSGPTGYRCMGVVGGDLYIGTGDNGYIYKLSKTNYVTTGWLQSSYFDANLPSIPKLYNAVTVRHDPLTNGQSIAIYYKFKESDDWTYLGISNTVGDIEKTLSFASGVTSNVISLKYILTTSDTLTTPRLTEVIMQYSLYPVRKWQWTLRLLAKDNLTLLDKTQDTRTATQIRTALEDLLNTEQLYTFTDVSGTSYSVLVVDIDGSSWVVNTDDVNENEVLLTLLEA